MSTFDLNDAIHAAIDGGESDPDVIAAKVWPAIPADHLEDVLRPLLNRHVRDVIRLRRNSGSGNPPEEEEEPKPRGKPASGGKSAKRRRIRESWRRKLTAPVNLGAGVWKVFEDCTYDDVMTLVDARMKLANENHEQAAHYRQFADAMERHSAATVGDLPTEELKELLA